MHIGVLSFRALNRHTTLEEKRLAEEGKKRNHEVSLLRFQRCLLTFNGQGTLGLRYGNRPFPDFDVVIPRVSVLTNMQAKIAIIKHLQLMGVPLINAYHPILRAKSKLQTLQVLSHYNIPVVKTAVINHVRYLEKAIDYIGQFPIIMKTAYGSLGEGVTIVESKRSAKSTYQLIADTLEPTNAILLQEYISESGGKDIRLFVVGNKVVASMERMADDGDFRSNIGQGGDGRAYTPSSEEKHLAIRAAKAIGLEIAGVDMIHTKHGPAIMEVNANPGFKELEEVSGVNVAESIVKFSVRFAKEYVPREL